MAVVLCTKERFERRLTGTYIGASGSRAGARASAGVFEALCVALALLSGLASAPARADQTHTVRPGQNLNTIARTYGVSISSLAARNKLSPDATVRDGQVLNLPEKGVVYIGNGQTLWSIARKHGCSVDTLARVNKLTTTTPLKPGMRLRLPGAAPTKEEDSGITAKAAGSGAAAKAAAASGGKRWGVAKRPGRVDLFRIATSEHLAITLVDQRGRVRPQAPRQLASFLRPRNAPSKQKPPHKRLVALLAEVSDHFGGRRINVASGYRLAKGYTSHQSRHVAGAAIDLRVEGVPNRALCDYLRHFDDVGVGFYPNSTFVHFDVRDRNAYWIDVSGPGQKPVYLSRADRDGYTGREKTEGLVELGASVAAAIEGISHGEPSEALSDDE